MQLKLENIGILQQAQVTLDGLTVIAGENDTGKSTVGKVLYSMIKTIKFSSNMNGSVETKNLYCDRFNRYIKNLFKNQISQDGTIEFCYDEEVFTVEIQNDRCLEFGASEDYLNKSPKMTSPLMIETPYIWNLIPSLKTISNLESQNTEVDFEVLETLSNLYFALTTKLKDDDKIRIDVESIINGAFNENGLGDFVFQKKGKNIELVNVAMGIKYFGILQVLSDKGHFYDQQILILDEPEVHLHPKWQLELAKVIVSLVKKGIKTVVNSHSPYMIEALQKYSDLEHLSHKCNYYIAQDQKIDKIEGSNSQTLSEIFEKLSEPFDEFAKIESQRLQNG